MNRLPSLLFALVLVGCQTSPRIAAPTTTPQSPPPTALASEPTGDQDRAPPPSASLTLPPDPSLPWRGETIKTDPGHAYSLPELIDLAQRSNPDTRIAWEQARQAALAVGLIEASYLPDLSAEVLGGFQHTPVPIPKSLQASGYFTLDTQELLPGLMVRWLLFDFGRREAAAEAASQTATALHVAFTGSHQKLIYEVSKAYFAIDAERAQRRVTEAALKNAEILEEAVSARRTRGLATVPEVAEAKRSVAKARYDLAEANMADNDVFHNLLETMGLSPTLKLSLADSGGRMLPKADDRTLDEVLQKALARRPDIVAALAKLRAAGAGIAEAEAAYRPSIALEGTVNENIGMITVNDRTYRVNEPAGGVLFRLKLPLFDGGMRDTSLAIARSKQREAQEELAKRQDEAVRQIARTRDALTAALASHDAAVALEAAAALAAEAALQAYRHGVGTFTDASSAETERVKAEAALAHAYATALSTAAALAFATGEAAAEMPAGTSR